MNLRLLQLADSALPIGGYTHSWGLEAALARRLVRDVESLEAWTANWLRHSLAPLEGVVAASVCRALAAEDWQTVAVANELLEASLAPPTLRVASREMGEELLALGGTWQWSAAGVARFARSTPGGAEERGWHHSVVFGLLGSLAGAGPRETVVAFLHQAALGMIGAGIRSIPVSHRHGQQLLAYLQDDIARLAEEMSARPLQSAGSSSPFYEVLCHEQPQLYSRMFRS